MALRSLSKNLNTVPGRKTLILFTGGIQSPVLMAYAALPISAAWLLGYRGTLWAAAGSWRPVLRGRPALRCRRQTQAIETGRQTECVSGTRAYVWTYVLNFS